MTVAPEMLAVVAGMAAVTYLLRAVPLLMLARTPAHPGPFAEYLRLVAPAILIALAAVGVALSEPAGGGLPELTLGSRRWPCSVRPPSSPCAATCWRASAWPWRSRRLPGCPAWPETNVRNGDLDDRHSCRHGGS